MNYTVILSPEEVEYCKQVAEMRSNERNDAGREAELKYHVIGCYGEYAVAKCLNRSWEGKYYEGETWKNRGNDVKGVEVKASFKGNSINLDLKDPVMFSDVPFVFVKLRKLGDRVGATLKGWIWGWEAYENKKGMRLTSRAGKEFLMVDKKYFKPMGAIPLRCDGGPQLISKEEMEKIGKIPPMKESLSFKFYKDSNGS